ncbi:hypothetical protein BV22DRAFT_488394 [Leucogyrophana mollusca]|uniref:Uncharacterized protein n=1 Tax=Leucogyrophana mollusca TaxID=85980 RepID=A0ACB8BGX5_9AGAM|nr:hypothetical protein BV22DRAFT_488394 [Leucogyrophana mollusca]
MLVSAHNGLSLSLSADFCFTMTRYVHCAGDSGDRRVLQRPCPAPAFHLTRLTLTGLSTERANSLRLLQILPSLACRLDGKEMLRPDICRMFFVHPCLLSSLERSRSNSEMAAVRCLLTCNSEIFVKCVDPVLRSLSSENFRSSISCFNHLPA